MAQTSAASLVPSTAPSPVTPTQQILFHVRFIDQWRPSTTSQSQRFAFFGLELELRGQNGSSLASIVLDFGMASQPQQQQQALRAITGPFKLVVVAKMPLDEANDQQKALLQLIVPVQVHNQLDRMNKVHFLKQCTTGADVYRELKRLLETVSVARPCELTFLRHNHAQATAKIQPFAARADVQKAQVAQFEKLQAEESKWPDERRKRKQFVLQQLDFYREHYLFDYIGDRLQSLHEEIMGGGQWHAYEFEKALWYYHAPTSELFAEHPMRNNEKTRELIGSVQLRTRMAARKLQHGVRAFLRRNRVINAAMERVLGVIVDELWRNCFDHACADAAAAQAKAVTTQFQAVSTKTGKVKGLLGKFMPRKVIKSTAIEETEPVVDSPPAEAVEPKPVEPTPVEPTPQEAMPVEPTPALIESRVERVPTPSIDVAGPGNVKRLRTPVPTLPVSKLSTEQTTQTDRLPTPVPTLPVSKGSDEQTTQTDRLPTPVPTVPVSKVTNEQTTQTNIEPLVNGAQDAEIRSPASRGESQPEHSVVVKEQLPPPELSSSVLDQPHAPVRSPAPLVRREPEPATPYLPVAAPPVTPAPRIPQRHPLNEPALSPEIVADIAEPLQSSTSFNPIPATVSESETVARDRSEGGEDDDDEDLPRNWRSRLRLLKSHYHERQISPKKMKTQAHGPHSSFVVGHGSIPFSSPIEPALRDRSTPLLLDLAIDGPLSSSVLTSLKEPKRRNGNDNHRIASPSWHRDGSFRSFHDFFNGSTAAESRLFHQTTSPRLPAAARYEYADEREPDTVRNHATSPLGSSKLPKLDPAIPVMTQPPPVAIQTDSKLRDSGMNVSIHPETAISPAQTSPPKKLPYIRRRKR